MRVTNNMLIANMLYNVNSNLQKMSEYQDELATGKKIQTPSDDPVGISKVLKYKTDLSELEQYETNARDALSWVETTEIALMDINDVLQRVRELTVQAANGTNSPDELTKIKDEVEQLKNHIVSASNTSFAGRYIFSSYQTDEKLMNDDGTFNINVTDYEVEHRVSTKYEIGIGETIDISTNGLDVFGQVDLENTLYSALPKMGVSRLEGNIDLERDYTVKQARHVGNYSFGTDYSSSDLDINMKIGNENYAFSVDENLLDGTTLALTQQDVIDAFGNAVDPTTAQKLSDLAEVTFDGSGNLVIEPHHHGDDTEISGGAAVFYGRAVKADIDPNTDYTTGHDMDITIRVAGIPTTFAVDESLLDGTLNKDSLLNIFKNADGGGPGPALDSVADVYYDTAGKLTIDVLNQESNVQLLTVPSSVFEAPMNTGKENDADKWDITLEGATYNVDETLLNGSVTALTENDVLTVLRNAPANAPNSGILSDVADIEFNDRGSLVITSKATGDLEFSSNDKIFVKKISEVDTDGRTESATKGKMLGALDLDGDYVVKKAIHKGAFDLTADYTGAVLDLTVDVDGTIYTIDVDESLLDGSITPLTEADVLQVFSDALDSTGGIATLSDIAEIEFDEDGNLIIEARTHGEDVSITGAGSIFGQKSVQATLDPTVDYSVGHDFEITLNVNGSNTVYSVDATQFDGTLSQQDVIDLFGNTTGPGSGALKSVADIYYDSSNQLVITAKTALSNVQISNTGASPIFTAPMSVGKGQETDNLDITLNGITYDVDESVLNGSSKTLDKETVISLFNNAKAYAPETGLLSEVADVFYDVSGNITIQAKTFGDEIEISGGTRIFNTSAIQGTFDLNASYTADTLDVTIDGVVFDVDESTFDGTTTAMTEEEVIEWFNTAPSGTGILGDVADVYFDSNSKLVIDVKDPQPETEISFDTLNNSIFNGTTPTNIGRAPVEVELPAGSIITDAIISQATGVQKFQITLNNRTETISMDLDNYSTTEQLKDGIQKEIDEEFPPGGFVEVTLKGDPGFEVLNFKTINTPQDGTVRTFDIKAIRSDKSKMITDLESLIESLESGDTNEVGKHIDIIQEHMDKVVEVTSDIGARTNRIELVLSRIGDNNINFTRLLSDAEDVDMAEIIMKLKNAENVYQASLSSGARIIQPSLMDFLR